MSISGNEDDIEGCNAQESAVVARAMVDAERAYEPYVDEYYDSIPAEEKGFSWFDDRLSDLHTTVDLNTFVTYHSEPRPYDKSPTSQEYCTRHRLVRLFASVASLFSLTDPFAIDMITHHGNDKIVNVILHPEV